MGVTQGVKVRYTLSTPGVMRVYEAATCAFIHEGVIEV